MPGPQIFMRDYKYLAELRSEVLLKHSRIRDTRSTIVGYLFVIVISININFVTGWQKNIIKVKKVIRNETEIYDLVTTAGSAGLSFKNIFKLN